MDVREIKELVLRTASKLAEAEAKLNELFDVRTGPEPRLFVACIPVFWRNFSINLRDSKLEKTVALFSLNEPADFLSPTYTFEGLKRWIPAHSHVVVGRDGLIFLHFLLNMSFVEGGAYYEIHPRNIDFILRRFLRRARDVYASAGINGPFLLKAMLHVRGGPFVGVYSDGVPGFDARSERLAAGPYKFPTVQADSLADLDATMFPICEQVHQTFGRASSPSFSPHGVWSERTE